MLMEENKIDCHDIIKICNYCYNIIIFIKTEQIFVYTVGAL